MIENCLKTMHQVPEGFSQALFQSFQFFRFLQGFKNLNGVIFLFTHEKQWIFLPNAEANTFLFLRFSLSYCRICRFAVFDAVFFAVAVAVAVAHRDCLCGCGCGCGQNYNYLKTANWKLHRKEPQNKTANRYVAVFDAVFFAVAVVLAVSVEVTVQLIYRISRYG